MTNTQVREKSRRPGGGGLLQLTVPSPMRGHVSSPEACQDSETVSICHSDTLESRDTG
jgi:hypothetical protein